MTMQRYVGLTIITVAILLLTFHFATDAQDGNQAALVIDYGEGNVETRCLAFDTPQISGYDLLEQSGLGLESDFQAGGAAVCRVGETGCPASDCFCQCRGGGECVYWSYWHQLEGQWLYSQIASNAYQVSDGAVEGWVWGPGSVTEAQPPPLLTHAEICQAASPVVAPGGRRLGIGWLPYAALGFILLALGALLSFTRSHARRLNE